MESITLIELLRWVLSANTRPRPDLPARVLGLN